MREAAGPGIVSCSSTVVVDPAILQQPSEERKNRFKTALNTLRLEPLVGSLQYSTSHPTSQTAPAIGSDYDGQANDQIVNDCRSVNDKMGETFNWPKLTILTSGTVTALPSE